MNIFLIKTKIIKKNTRIKEKINQNLLLDYIINKLNNAGIIFFYLNIIFYAKLKFCTLNLSSSI